jgi:hypothetical protein
MEAISIPCTYLKKKESYRGMFGLRTATLCFYGPEFRHIEFKGFMVGLSEVVQEVAQPETGTRQQANQDQHFV